MTDVDIAALLKNFADDIKTDLKKDIAANADISIKNHEETRKELGGLRGELHEVKSTVHILWRKVNGPNVPPPKGSGEYRQIDATLAKEKPIVETVSDHNLDLESLKAQVTVLDRKTDTLSEQVQGTTVEVKEAKNIAEQVLAMNKEQNKSLGIGVSIQRIGEFFTWLKTKEGQRYAATIFAAATSLVTAMGTTYALVTNRLPAPNSPPYPVPSIQTVLVPVPMPSLTAPGPSGSASHP